MVGRLENKTIFITGGNSGIGLASAQEFVAQGATVIILARSQEKADQALSQIDGEASALIGDVSDPDSLKAAYDSIAKTHGGLDGVMVSAGIAPPTPLGQVTPEQFDHINNVNVKGAFFAVQYAAPLLKEGSAVVLVSSCLNEMGMQGHSIYNATKAAVRSLARSLTPDLQAIGSRINVLSPGPVRTEVMLKAGLPAEMVDAQYASFDDTLPARRMGRPDEMAKTALFLISDDSSYMYGAEIQADGGMNQTRWQA